MKRKTGQVAELLATPTGGKKDSRSLSPFDRKGNLALIPNTDEEIRLAGDYLYFHKAQDCAEALGL